MKLPSVSATVELLEGQELEGNLDAAGFNLLLAHYLLNFHHLRDAQLLWKRIPEELKVADGEMCRIWQVGQCLLAKNVSQLYQLGEETPWSPPVQPLMSELMEVVRRRAFALVLKSFTSISVDQFASLVHVPVEKAVEDAMILGWERDEPANMLKPRSTLHADGDIIPNEQRISNMVGFVTFLEN